MIIGYRRILALSLIILIQSYFTTTKAKEFLVYDEVRTFTDSENGFHYFQYEVGAPSNWRSPDDYYGGTWYFRYQILDVPSNTNYQLSTCIWSDWVNSSNFKETCSGQALINSAEGSYFHESSPSNWWKKDGVPVDFSKPNNIHQLGVVLWTENLCNVSPWVSPNCWGERSKFLPMRIRVTIVAVANGTSFSGWQNYGSSSGGNTNKAPTITSSAVTSATEGVNYKYQVKATDPDNDPLEYYLTNNPGWLTINKSTGFISGTPTSSHIGNNSVQVQVKDSKGASDSQSFTINVKKSNTAPYFTSNANTGATEDVQYKYQLVAKDPDGDQLTFSIIKNPGWLAINENSGLLSGIPRNSNVGNNNVEVAVNDGKGGNGKQAFTIVVKNTNDPPVISSNPIKNATEDKKYSYQIQVNDPDNNDVISYSAPKKPGWLSLNATSGLLTGTPLNSDVGQAEIQIQATDKQGAKANQAFTLTVINVNDPPIITSNAIISATEDKIYQYQVKATDQDVGDAISFSLVNSPGWLSINSSSGFVSGKPLNEHVGENNVQVRVSDKNGGHATQAFKVTVSNTNDLPEITSAPVTNAKEDVLYKYIIVAKDPDLNDKLTISLTKSPEWITINTTTRVLSGVPLNQHVGKHEVELIVTDKAGLQDAQSFTINVINSNDAPVISSAPKTQGIEDVQYQYQVIATDPDKGDKIKFSIAENPGWLKIDPLTGVLSGIPLNEHVGNNEVKIKADDSNGGTDVQSFIIEVENTNDPPFFSKSFPKIQIEEDDSISVKLSEYKSIIIDPDHDFEDLGYEVYSGEHVEAKLNGNSIIVVPDKDWHGLDSIQLVVHDNFDSTSSRIIVEVLPINDFPELIGFPDTVLVINDRDVEFALNEFVIDVDSDSAAFTFYVEYDSAEISVSLDSTTNVLQLTSTGYFGESSITIELDDGSFGMVEDSNLCI